MTSPDLRYETDHVASLLPQGLSKELRSRYCKSWNGWLAWCQEHKVHPGEAERSDVARFAAQLPAVSREYIQRDVATIYFKLGGANPARRIRPLTPDGAQKNQRRWNAWVTWCELHSAAPLPADADQLAAYLDEAARKKSPRYAVRVLATISRTHIEHNLPDPQRAAPAVARKIADIKAAIDQDTKPRRASPVPSPCSVRRDEGIWRRWSKWCASRGKNPMPDKPEDGLKSVGPEDVVAFLTEKWRTGSYDYARILYRSLKNTYGSNGAEQNPVDYDLVRKALGALKQDLSPPAEGDDPAALPEDDYGFPDGDALQHLAVSSRNSYRSYWRTWSQWCVGQEIDPFGATPEQLARFLGEEADRLEMKSVELYVAAIGCVYEVAAPDNKNPARDLLVARKMKALKVLHGKPPSQVTALTAEGFASIQATAKRPRPWETKHEALVRGTTDLAMIGIMRDAMLRASESAALTWDDLEEEEDGSGRVYIARSKTDQEGEGAVLYVSPQTMEWLKQMRELVMEGPTIFGLARKSIYHRIKDAAEYAGLEGRYGSHSMRIGMAQDLARANTSMPLLMQAGRWKSPAGPTRYIRKIAAGHNAVAQWYEQHPGRALLEPDEEESEAAA